MKNFMLFSLITVFVFPFVNWHFKLMPRTDKTLSIEIDTCEEFVPSEWFKFKSAAYDTACSLNKDLGFNMSNLQVYDGLMKVFFSESKFKGTAANPISSARGIIQFMRSTRNKLGIPHNIAELSELEQLHYVSLYYRDRIKSHNIDCKKVDSFIDIYMVVFAPAYTTAPDWKCVYKSCEHGKKICPWYAVCLSMVKANKESALVKGKDRRRCAYHANWGYDRNKDGKILKAEIRDYILKKHYQK